MNQNKSKHQNNNNNIKQEQKIDAIRMPLDQAKGLFWRNTVFNWDQLP